MESIPFQQDEPILYASPHHRSLDYFSFEYGGSAIAFYVPIAYIYPQIPMLFGTVVLGDRISFATRIIGSFVVQAIVLIILPFLAPIGMWVTLVATLLIGVTTSILQPSLFGFSSLFP